MKKSHGSMVSLTIGIVLSIAAMTYANWDHLGPYTDAVPSYTPVKLHLIDSKGRIYGASYSLIRSDDQGVTWNELSLPRDLRNLRLDADDNLYGIIINPKRKRVLCISYDYGISWSPYRQESFDLFDLEEGTDLLVHPEGHIVVSTSSSSSGRVTATTRIHTSNEAWSRMAQNWPKFVWEGLYLSEENKLVGISTGDSSGDTLFLLADFDTESWDTLPPAVAEKLRFCRRADGNRGIILDTNILVCSHGDTALPVSYMANDGNLYSFTRNWFTVWDSARGTLGEEIVLVLPIDEDRISVGSDRVLFTESETGLYRSLDLGQTWTFSYGGKKTVSNFVGMKRLTILESGGIVAYGTSAGLLCRTQDKRWIPCPQFPFDVDPGCNYLISQGNRIVHIGSNSLNVLEDTGQAWKTTFRRNTAAAVGAGRIYYYYEMKHDDGKVVPAISVDDYDPRSAVRLPGIWGWRGRGSISANRTGQVCCITHENYRQKIICTSLDSGKTWFHRPFESFEVEQTARDTMMVRVNPWKIYINDNNRIYALFRAGIIASDDYGLTWPIYIQTYPAGIEDVAFDGDNRMLTLLRSPEGNGVFLVDEHNGSLSRLGDTISGSDLHIGPGGDIYVAGRNGISRLDFPRSPDSSFVHLISPDPGDLFTNLETSILVQVNVSSNCDHIEFYNSSTLLGTATTTPYSFTWQNPPTGEHSLTARMVTTDGRSVTSAPVVITVGNTNSVVNGFAGPKQRVMLRAIGRGRVQLTVRAERQFHVRAFDSKGRLVISEQGRGNFDRILPSPSGFLHFVVEHDGMVFRRKLAIIN